MGASDTFADLGSGLGRACIQAVREFRVAKSVGVELAPSRHRLALAERAREADAIASRVELVEADCAEDLLWTGALAGTTLMFAGSLLFGDELMARLARRIEGCASVRAVATLKQFVAAADSGGGAFACALSGFTMLVPSEEYET
eukprot:4316902-Prymnesium_polylepis.1